MSNHSPHTRSRWTSNRTPNFDSGLIAEPMLVFGGHHHHVDPKTGLSLYGPYSPTGQQRPPLQSLTVGIVGPAAMVGDAEQWLQVCTGALTNDGSQPFLYPHFPGFNENMPFQCRLITGGTWREVITASDLQKALAETDFTKRIKAVIALYIKGIEVLKQRDPKPSVILCCIPQEVIDYCTVTVTRAGESRRIKVSRSERQAEIDRRRGQLSLFDSGDDTDSD